MRSDLPCLRLARAGGVYALINTLRFEAGSPLYGDISLVLSPAVAAATSLLSPFDTGSWTALCNTTGPPPYPMPTPPPHNCSAYAGHAGLGTLNHTAAALLSNEAYWRTPEALHRTLQRLLAPEHAPPPIHGPDLVRYLEAVPAATLRFPRDVKVSSPRRRTRAAAMHDGAAERAAWCPHAVAAAGLPLPPCDGRMHMRRVHSCSHTCAP
jgi:hypothetical protein